MHNLIDIHEKAVKSYASKARLLKELETFRALAETHGDRFIIVRTESGRWTAVAVLNKSVGGFVMRYPFLTV